MRRRRREVGAHEERLDLSRAMCFPRQDRARPKTHHRESVTVPSSAAPSDVSLGGAVTVSSSAAPSDVARSSRTSRTTTAVMAPWRRRRSRSAEPARAAILRSGSPSLFTTSESSAASCSALRASSSTAVSSANRLNCARRDRPDDAAAAARR